jgi:hypothetical protein
MEREQGLELDKLCNTHESLKIMLLEWRELDFSCPTLRFVNLANCTHDIGTIIMGCIV